MRRTRRLVLAGFLVVAMVAALAVTILVGREQPRSDLDALRERLSQSLPTVRAATGNVVLRETFPGVLEVVRGRNLTLPPDAPALVVTSVSMREGLSVREGQVIATVQGAPVVVLEGPIPAYRELRAGLSGPDIDQFHGALARLNVPCACGRTLLKSELRAFRSRMFASTAERLDGQVWKDRVPIEGIVWLPVLPVTIDKGNWRAGQVSEKSIATTRRSSRRVRVRRVAAESQVAPGQTAVVSGSAGGQWKSKVGQVFERDAGTRSFILRGALPSRVRGRLEVRVKTLTRPGTALIVPASAVGTSPSGTDRIVVLRGTRKLSKAVSVVAELGDSVAVRGRGLRSVEEIVVADRLP